MASWPLKLIFNFFLFFPFDFKWKAVKKTVNAKRQTLIFPFLFCALIALHENNIRICLSHSFSPFLLLTSSEIWRCATSQRALLFRLLPSLTPHRQWFVFHCFRCIVDIVHSVVGSMHLYHHKHQHHYQIVTNILFTIHHPIFNCWQNDLRHFFLRIEGYTIFF